MKTKIFIVINPVAGFGNVTNIKKRLINLCTKSGIQADIYLTKPGGEGLAAEVRQAVINGNELVLVCGGDGTISGAASGLVSTGVPMAIIPIGTGNALAKELGIPRTVEKAFDLINKPHSIIKMDAMKINDSHYLLNVGVGLSSIIIKSTQRHEKRRYGVFAYLWKAIIAFAGLQPYKYKLLIDGKRVNQNASEIFIAGGGIIGVQLPQLSQDIVVKPDDGILDIFVIKARTIKDYLALGFNILYGRPRHAPQLLYFQARKRIVVITNRELPIESDGEFIGFTPLIVDLIPSAIDIVVPQKRPGAITRWKEFVKLIDSSNKMDAC